MATFYAYINNIRPVHLPATVKLYRGGQIRRQTVSVPSLEKVENFQGVPTYSILTIQDVYLTNFPNQYLVPLFFNIEPLFTSGSYYHQVTEADQHRPDLISDDYYDTTDYYWIVLFANNILDPFDLKIGTVLRLPLKETILSSWLGVR